ARLRGIYHRHAGRLGAANHSAGGTTNYRAVCVTSCDVVFCGSRMGGVLFFLPFEGRALRSDNAGRSRGQRRAINRRYLWLRMFSLANDGECREFESSANQSNCETMLAALTITTNIPDADTIRRTAQEVVGRSEYQIRPVHNSRFLWELLERILG